MNLSTIKGCNRLIFSSSFSMSLCTDIQYKHARSSCSILFLKKVLILFKHEKDLSNDKEDIAIVAFNNRSLKTSEKHDCKLRMLM